MSKALRFAAAGVASVLALGATTLTTTGAFAAATAKKAVAARAGAACPQGSIGKSSGNLVCTLDGGKTKWLPVPAPAPTPAATVAVDASKEEKGDKKLVVACGAQEDWCQAMTKAFEKETGINTSYVRLSSGETVARLNAAKSNPEFDVWHGGPSDGYEVAKGQGLLENYISPNAAAIPASYKEANGAWTGVYIGVVGFCSNKSVLNRLSIDVPRSWTALTNPKLKGQYATAHPSTSGTAYTALWTMVQITGSEDGAIDYFKTLHPNVFQYTKSGTTPSQMAGRGEVAVALNFSHDCLKYYDEGLTDLVVSFPAEGTGYEIGGSAIIKGAKNPNAARKYIDWVLTAKSQEIPPTVKSYQLPTNPAAKISPRAIKLSEVRLVNYDDAKAGAAKKALTARFDAEVTNAPK